MMANVEISILGQPYKIACPEGEELTLQNTVEQFNEKLKKIKTSSRALRNEQLIVMAALNFCHELNAEKAKNTKQTEQLSKRIHILQESIEAVLQTDEKKTP
ncbi:cell division protein ZapA [Psychromonas antarctica]|uniref:cell division protein ZapA n=1 Tax=Psychromonas antarctica TaxID=67573 RepID=UPI001EE85011|nr:cell division protein ZapA [Psychromonas antarctica]MCG6201019.1 cell division protein ZapA [Psychromonas antarctica]